MVLDVDQNDNGMIEFNEFLQMMSKKMREGDSEDELKEAFKYVSKNHYQQKYLDFASSFNTLNVSRGIFLYLFKNIWLC